MSRGNVLWVVPGTAPVFEGKVAVGPSAIGRHDSTSITQLDEVTRDRCFVRQNFARMPALVNQTCHSIEVEQHAARVQVVEGGSGSTVDGRHVNGAFFCTFRHDETDRGLRNIGKFGDCHIAGEYHFQRYIGIVHEIVARDAHFRAGRSIFARHGRQGRSRNCHAEVIFHGLSATGHHVYFVGDFGGYGSWNIYQYRVVCHVTVVQDGLLVIEVQFVDAAQVFTHQADGSAGGGSRYQGVGRSRIR